MLNRYIPRNVFVLCIVTIFLTWVLSCWLIASASIAAQSCGRTKTTIRACSLAEHARRLDMAR